ncbi:MAG: hypothetical protein IPL40_08750 [Proteobacteria bacterium]|nr:hypothetical protein [Pseudomonadota bacterium]
MPSSGPATKGWLPLLRSQGLGLLCGQGAVLLLAIGSIVLAATREGASARVQLDDLRAFFAPPSAWHLWLYLLIVVLVIYGLNTALCTWQSTLRKWRGGQRSPWAHGPALLHLAFLVALLAHLIGGLGGSEQPPLVLTTTGFTRLDAQHRARLRTLRLETHPDGSRRQATARLTLEAAGGARREVDLRYNEPLVLAAGTRLLLLAGVFQQAGQPPEIALRVRQAPGTPWALASALLLLLGLVLMQRRFWA